MAKVDIARALKDQAYFNSLSPEEQAQVKAANPSGEVEVDDDSLDSASGGIGDDGGFAAITGTGSTGTAAVESPSGGIEPAAPQNCNCNC